MIALGILPVALWAMAAQAALPNLMEIVFNEPTNNTSDQCTRSSNTIGIQIHSIPAAFTCFDMNATFSNPDPDYNYTQAGYSCLDDSPCGVNFTRTDFQNWNPETNYSQVLYTQSGSGVKGPLIFQTYNGPNCRQQGDPIQPWIRWTCNSDNGTCSALPYGVGSFAILMTEGNDNQEGESDRCLVAAAYANGAIGGGVGGGMVALVVAAVGVAWLG